jgi:hypothetical protein
MFAVPGDTDTATVSDPVPEPDPPFCPDVPVPLFEDVPQEANANAASHTTTNNTNRRIRQLIVGLVSAALRSTHNCPLGQKRGMASRFRPAYLQLTGCPRPASRPPSELSRAPSPYPGYLFLRG